MFDQKIISRELKSQEIIAEITGKFYIDAACTRVKETIIFNLLYLIGRDNSIKNKKLEVKSVRNEDG